jgi:hypothetical protein
MKENVIEVYFLNDRKIAVTVEVSHKTMQNEYGIYKFKMSDTFVLEPSQGQLFKVDAPVGTAAFVKTWDNRVLITYMDTDKVEMS